MLSTAKFREPCFRCRQDLLYLFKYGFASELTTTGRTPRQFIPLAAKLRDGPSPRPVLQNRCFSATRVSHQSPSDSDRLSKPEDIETFVRQARQTFGDTLPTGYFSPEEYKVYERLFGPPLRLTRPEDVGVLFTNDLRETDGGNFEEVEYIPVQSAGPDGEQGAISDGVEGEDLEYDLAADPRLDYLNVVANNKRELAALVKLKDDFEAASLRALRHQEEVSEEVDAVQRSEDQEEVAMLQQLEDSQEEERSRYRDSIVQQWERHNVGPRTHPLTVEGRFKTNPGTVHMPKDAFVEPITELLRRADTSHVKEAAENAFGGPGLPFSALTPGNMRNAKQIGVALEAAQHMSEIEADAYLATVLPTVYASAASIFVEVRKRLGREWIRGLMKRNDGKGPRVLDVGAGGAGLLAWEEVLRAEWEVMQSEGKVDGIMPWGKKTAVVNNTLRHRMSRLLQNTTFLPRLPDYLHSAENVEKLLDAPAVAQPRKTYDIIIMAHSLMPLNKAYKRTRLLDNIWAQLNPDGGLLIVLEKGHPRGFEAVADARARILDDFIIPPSNSLQKDKPETIDPTEIEQIRPAPKEPGMIVAPCTNHENCPMYLSPGYSHGRKDFCHFGQRFIRPQFMQKVMGARRGENHEDVNFSYIAVRRGPASDGAAIETREVTAWGATANGPGGPWQGKEATDRAFQGYGSLHPSAESDIAKQQQQSLSMLSLPRNVLPPMKGRGNVAMDLCTPSGEIERWVVPRSYGKQAYHDARKARWGDLWALGAKTRYPRALRLGKPGDSRDVANPLGDGVPKVARDKKPRKIDLNVGLSGKIESATESSIRKPMEKRTKGGRKSGPEDLLAQLERNEGWEYGRGFEDEEGDDVSGWNGRPGKGLR